MKDLIIEAHGINNPEVKCLDHGVVRLVDAMPRLVYDDDINTCDHAVTQAARVSYAYGTKKLNEDIGLIRYLMRHRHTTPTEMVEFKFHCKMPIFVARQQIRHRTASVNELSARYSKMPEEFYIPEAEDLRAQSMANKQISEGAIDLVDAEQWIQEVEEHCKKSYELYERGIDFGIGRELARMVIPVNVYTEWYWKIDLHNLLHFLSLRCDSHAQKEIRVFADAILTLIKPLIPHTIGAWNDYHPYRGGELLSRMEMDAIRTFVVDGEFAEIDSENKREIKEWHDKCKILELL